MIKKVKISLFLYLLFFTFSGMNQTVFHKTFGGYGMEYTRGMEYQPGGNYIVSGITNSFSGGINHLFLSEINTSGQVLWFNTYGQTYYNYGGSGKKTSDGDYIMVGNFNSNSINLIKTNSTGDTLWTKAFTSLNILSFGLIFQTADNGYALLGSEYIIGVGKIVLMKTDSIGNLIWTKRYSAANSIFPGDILQTDDGGYIITGSISNSPQDYDMLIFKTDSMGNVLISQVFAQSNQIYEYSCSIIKTSDNGFLMTGIVIPNIQSLFSCIHLIKFNNILDTLWTRSLTDSYYDNNYYSYTFSKQTMEGGYVIAGTSGTSNIMNNSHDTSGIFLLKTDEYGFPLWSKRYGEENIYTLEMANSVFQTNDKGFIISGTTSGAGAFLPYINDIYLIKTDSLGNTNNCMEINSNYTTVYLNTVILPLNLTSTSLILNPLQLQLNVFSHTIMDSLLCVLVSKPEIDQIPSEISYYPNPFSDYTRVQYQSNGFENDKLLLFDLTGRLLRELKCNNGECDLYRESLKKGMYMIQIVSDKQIIGSGKIIVE